MKYSKVVKAKFLSRPNRFIAYCEIDGNTEVVHVKNTGRCRELLVPNATVYLSVSDNPERKTKFDLIAVEKVTPRGTLMINMDSQAPNTAAHEWIASGGVFGEGGIVRREVTYGRSRFDLYIEHGERRAFVEVKGVTLENDGVASFPDAPTERGVKHIKELTALAKAGHPAYILFITQMKGVTALRPNDETHPAFGDALRKAREAGVHILAVDCMVETAPNPDGTLSLSVTADRPIPVEL
jgi:sugar fermentation stimulation protein A